LKPGTYTILVISQWPSFGYQYGSSYFEGVLDIKPPGRCG